MDRSTATARGTRQASLDTPNITQSVATGPLPPAATAALKRLEAAFNPTSSQPDEFLRQARTAQTVVARFPAGHPRGSWPAEEHAAELTASGRPATVVMDSVRDEYLVKAVTA